jgi:hypothetical protein
MPDSKNRDLTVQPDLDEHDRGAKPVTSSTPLWKRRGNYFFLGMLAIWTSQWALKQIGWFLGWNAQPVQGRLGHLFDAMVILAAGIVLLIQASIYLCRPERDRQAMLDRLHDKALKSKQA